MFQFILFFLFLLCRFNVNCENTDYVKTIPEVLLSDDYEDNSGYMGSARLNRTLVPIVTKKYESKADVKKTEQEKILLYGVKSWKFPVQDVHLTLTYPTILNDSEYLITHFLVFLHIDSDDSKGFIERGGLLHNHIEMSFTVSNASELTYQFWLYGVHYTSIKFS